MRRRSVSREERELWRRAVRDVSPLRRKTPDGETSSESKPAASNAARRAAPAVPAQRAPAARANLTHFVYAGGDPRADRAASSGRLAIEGTLDLHGMTQAEAHRALLQFIASAAYDGARLVLVITGKGKASSKEARGGVLKSRFLDWIEERALKSDIARVSPAKQKDGGAGAFYVFLKRKGARKAPRV